MKDINTLLSMIRKMYKILDKKQRKNFVITLLVILIGAGFELLGVTAIMPFIQAIISPQVFMENEYVSIILKVLGVDTARAALNTVGIMIIGVYFIKNIYLLLSSYIQVKYKNNLNQSLSVLMLRSYMERPYEFFVNTNSGDILRGMTTDVDGVCNVIELLFKFAAEGFVVFLIVGFIFAADVIMASGVMLVGLITMLIVILGVKRNMSRMGRINARANANNYKHAIQSVGGIKDIIVYDKKDYFTGEYEKSYNDKRVSTIHYQFVGAFPERIIEAFCISGIIITALYKLNGGVDTSTFVPVMGVFAVAAFRLLPSVSRITGYVANLIYYRPTLENAYENIIDSKQYMSGVNTINSGLLETPTSFKEVLSIDNIEWKYQNATKSVLKNLSMYIKEGESVGIIGESGSGKSTLSDILLRLYKPLSGRITMDGRDIFDIREEWSKMVGYVPQSVFLLDDTIKKNVAFGEKEINDDKVRDALTQAQLWDYVSNLPEGLDTIIGERGIKFSGGQRQRIAIARALYFNPQVLILDEATSALDNDTESAVMEAVEKLHGKMTMIIIAHRLTTISKCDRIYEISNGKAIEVGSIDNDN